MNEMAKLRNIVLVAHGGAGKTSLAEYMLFKAGVTTRLGRVEDGNTAMDFQPEEVQRTISLASSFHQFPWKKSVISLIDTPGDQNFFSNAKTCLPAGDGALLLVDGTDGVNVRTEEASGFANDLNLPTAIFINKLDRERADFSKSLDDVKESLTPNSIAVHLPIGKEQDFKGVVDLLAMKAYLYDEEGKASATDIPADMMDDVEAERESLIENIAESDDELLERYLEGEELTNDEIFAAFKKGILSHHFMPVLCGSATLGIGVDLLSDFIVEFMPSPEDRGAWTGTDEKGEEEVVCNPDPDAPFCAQVFSTIIDPYAGRLSIFRIVSGTLGGDGKFYNVNTDSKERFTQLLKIEGKNQKPITGAGPGEIVAVAKLKDTNTGDTLCDDAMNPKVKFPVPEPIHPVISFAISAKNKGEEDKVFSSLTKLMEEDISLKLERNTETKEILLKGLGLVHIEATIEKVKRKFNVEVEINTPKVPYRETIRKKIRVQGKHKKQSGGHGQFGDCWVEFQPLQRGEGFQFEDKIVGGSIPKTYIPAVEKGIVESCEKGVLAGFPCVDFKAVLDDGSYHSVDSSEMAFKVAGSLAYKNAIPKADPVLLEPIMEIAIVAPDDFTGDIMGDLNSRRGRVLGMDSAGKNQVVKAHVPMSEFLTYAPDLRSMTGGRGTFTMEFSHYDEVPFDISQKVIEKIKKEQEA